jgi:hypothetical protein
MKVLFPEPDSPIGTKKSEHYHALRSKDENKLTTQHDSIVGSTVGNYLVLLIRQVSNPNPIRRYIHWSHCLKLLLFRKKEAKEKGRK